ncbi:3-phosphoshikimate 1-carboxyvinyltransferase [Sphingomonas alba]|uniref:3-phosphoshikimate 1-carboxyvinyltransferase n=1 Tax=Sphingomonas alba TaxID=2908208 RepID=A0ABT0RMV0_9SPHN|nr:3-phosphoshikimate 1-carboxyvinyltransferase [Sphingomonas alba]MCL6683972.1 3-phosphoshikimate 1-carboxyvinyltransferase [Sphingomonas alba]
MDLRSMRSGPISGIAEIPGDKSCSHRALILGALADGETRISGLLVSEDVMATRRAVEAFGARVEEVDSQWRVTGAKWRSPPGPIDCGNSGTTARILMGAAAGFDLTATFTGDDSLSRRPMARVMQPLARMGAELGGGDRLPITLRGRRLGGIDWVNEPSSAQVKSALLLAGLKAHGAVTVREPSLSRDHTEIMLREFGCDVVQGDDFVALGDMRELTGCEIAIGADPSSAAFALTAAAIVPGSSVEVRDLLVNPLRTGLFESLDEMGADVELSDKRLQSGEVVATLRIGHAPLQPIEIPPERIPAMIDEIPLLAVAAAFADGESAIHGLAELRHKESNRLDAVIAGLTACGVTVVAGGDSLHIVGRGRVRGGARIAAQGDHRIAMAFLVLGLASDEPVTVDSAEMISTSFPGFAETMRALGANIE